MSIDLCILASGSSGNCTLVRTPVGSVLIDAGIGPRIAGRRLGGTGASLLDVVAVCLTHLDGDHFNLNWVDTLVQRGVRVYCHGSRAGDLRAIVGNDDFAQLIAPFGRAPFEPLRGLRLAPVALAHDAAGSHGFVLDGFGCRVGYATDLGHVGPNLLEQFRDLDVLAIESNYDPQMQLDSPRPWFLKRRIMGGRGHLSNQQAFNAVRAVLNRCESRGRRLPRHIVLLHRSRQCNCPRRVRELFARDPRIAPRLTLAEQYERTQWLRAEPTGAPLEGEQLSLSFG